MWIRGSSWRACDQFILKRVFSLRKSVFLPLIWLCITEKNVVILMLQNNWSIFVRGTFFYLVHIDNFFKFHCICMKIGSHTKWIVQISNMKSELCKMSWHGVIAAVAALLILRHDLFIILFNWHQKWKAHHLFTLVAKFHSSSFIIVWDIPIWKLIFLYML